MNDISYSSGRLGNFRARINAVTNSFSLTGKCVFYTLAIVFAGSVVALLVNLNSFFLVEIPARGGTITEGVLGLPHYINPVLAVTDGDKDLTSLIYSGLMRATPAGTLIPDLAESYTISPDGKAYTFVLKKDAVFHDGKPVTANDVVFTIQKIQDPLVKSPKQANWTGVAIEKVDERTVRFGLKQPYAPFLENTTIGILPAHIWSSTKAETFSLDEHNMSPIGTGPYKLKAVRKNANAIPTSYTLEANKTFVLGAPYIRTITFKFYPTEKALKEAYLNREVTNINGISPRTAVEVGSRGAPIYISPLPRVFGVFFNQTGNDALAQKEVRRALDMSVNRAYIVNTVLQGFGTPLTSPMPQSFVGGSPSSALASPQLVSTAVETQSRDSLIGEANALLDKAGWTLNADGIREKKTKKGTTTLAFSISTSDAPELKDIAEIVKSEWRKIGADVTIKIFEGGYLNQNIIRPRKYDALLFGQIVNKDFDLYAFWHSSQRTDPGLNIALYANPKADVLLEKIRTTSDSAVREKEYAALASEISADTPVAFLYSPNLIYVTSPAIKNITIGTTGVPSDRFSSVYTWHVLTDRVWKIFAPHN